MPAYLVGYIDRYEYHKDFYQYLRYPNGEKSLLRGSWLVRSKIYSLSLGLIYNYRMVLLLCCSTL